MLCGLRTPVHDNFLPYFQKNTFKAENAIKKDDEPIFKLKTVIISSYEK